MGRSSGETEGVRGELGLDGLVLVLELVGRGSRTIYVRREAACSMPGFAKLGRKTRRAAV